MSVRVAKRSGKEIRGMLGGTVSTATKYLLWGDCGVPKQLMVSVVCSILCFQA